jgi:hypothetical protein
VAKIDDVQIPSLLFTEGSAPSTPASGFGRLYVKTTGLFFIGDNGVEVGPMAASGIPLMERVLVYHSTTQSINNNSATAVTFDSERTDPDGYHAGGSPTRLTVPSGKDGLYLITGHIEFASSTQDSQEMVLIRLGGATYIARHTAGEVEKGATGGVVSLSVSTIYPLVATNYVELMAFQLNTGATARNVNASGNYSPEFRMVRISS